jgi:outer membrane murein-binding lipoprotein Lpp
MREGIILLAFVVIFAGLGLGLGTAWKPQMDELTNLSEDLTYCEMDRDAARTERDTAQKAAAYAIHQRDRAVASLDDMTGWYNTAHEDRTRLAAKLGESDRQINQLYDEIRAAQAAKPVQIVASSIPLPVKKRLPPPQRQPRKVTRPPPPPKDDTFDLVKWLTQ